jgi:hypothetical protein
MNEALIRDIESIDVNELSDKQGKEVQALKNVLHRFDVTSLSKQTLEELIELELMALNIKSYGNYGNDNWRLEARKKSAVNGFMRELLETNGANYLDSFSKKELNSIATRVRGKVA